MVTLDLSVSAAISVVLSVCLKNCEIALSSRLVVLAALWFGADSNKHFFPKARAWVCRGIEDCCDRSCVRTANAP